MHPSSIPTNIGKDENSSKSVPKIFKKTSK